MCIILIDWLIIDTNLTQNMYNFRNKMVLLKVKILFNLKLKDEIITDVN